MLLQWREEIINRGSKCTVQSGIDNLNGMFPERSSEFAAPVILFSDWFTIYRKIDEPVSEELDVFDPSDLESCDEMGNY